jgi:hypothetical protein
MPFQGAQKPPQDVRHWTCYCVIISHPSLLPDSGFGFEAWPGGASLGVCQTLPATGAIGRRDVSLRSWGSLRHGVAVLAGLYRSGSVELLAISFS